MKSRATRRHSRFQTQVIYAGEVITGMASNISETGLYVRLLREMVEKSSLEPDATIRVRFVLPGHALSLETDGQISWSNLEDYDSNGWPALGLGIEFRNSSSEFNQAIAKFVSAVGYTIIVHGFSNSELERVSPILEPHYSIIQADTYDDVIQTLTRTAVAVVLVNEIKAESHRSVKLFQLISDEVPYSKAIRIVLGVEAGNDLLLSFAKLGKGFHYLTQPYRNEDLLNIVRRAVDMYALAIHNERLEHELQYANQRLLRENAYLRKRYQGIEGFEEIGGTSAQLTMALKQLQRVIDTDATVHLHGETGTGKELFARALHSMGPRSKGPLVAQNCAGMSESLLQSTLFGHQKGAFTGADRNHAGIIQQADGGTLYLDEVAEMSHLVQGALLRCLQERCVIPIGGTRPIAVDIRIVSATHRDLQELVKQGLFREDLFFRLVVFQVDIPPLREREGDIPLLARHFLDLLCERHNRSIPGFSSPAMTSLEAYSWPGNIRELENAVERAILLSDDGQKVMQESLSSVIREASSKAWGVAELVDNQNLIGDGDSYDQIINSLQKQLIGAALEESKGSIVAAAKILGLERSRLGKLIKKLGVR